MPNVTVEPDEFKLVRFDAPSIVTLVERLIADVGLPDDLAVRVEVDETTPLGRAVVASYGDPIVLALESGALEDPKKPRQLSDGGSADVLGRLLLRVFDRRDPDFGDPPSDDDLSLPQSVAWDAYCAARLVRLGYAHFNQRQRRLYHFRNRHGFTDAADDAFERLWTEDAMTWDDVCRVSESALAAREPAG